MGVALAERAHMGYCASANRGREERQPRGALGDGDESSGCVHGWNRRRMRERQVGEDPQHH